MTGLSPNRIRLGIPKGSLEASTLAIFERIGLHFSGGSRALWLDSSDADIEPVLLKPQEIPLYVRTNRLDAGFSGRDWIVEQDVVPHVTHLAELPFSRQTSNSIRWVLAVPEQSNIRSVDDLRREADAARQDPARQPFVISTELVRISRMWLARNGIDATAEFSWGATEAKAEHFADAIIEGTETGASLRANRLRVIDEVFSSTNQFFANRHEYETYVWKRNKLDGLANLIKGAIDATDLVELRISSRRELDVQSILGDRARSISSTRLEDGSFSSTATVTRDQVPEILPRLAEKGATRTLVFPMSIYFSTPTK